MKTLILSAFMILSAYFAYAQNINIPDTAFLHALIVNGVDISGDSLISYSEAEEITYLDVS